jgi:cytidine deaminase
MRDRSTDITEKMWKKLSEAAWKCRNHAYVLGNTKVGASVMSEDGTIFVGCNIEHRFRCHDVHAEVNAITSMVAAGHTKLLAILIVAEREFFTPCGGCMDWIFQFGDPSCLVGFQQKRAGKIKIFLAKNLMPHYPK